MAKIETVDDLRLWLSLALSHKAVVECSPAKFFSSGWISKEYITVQHRGRILVTEYYRYSGEEETWDILVAIHPRRDDIFAVGMDYDNPHFSHYERQIHLHSPQEVFDCVVAHLDGKRWGEDN